MSLSEQQGPTFSAQRHGPSRQKKGSSSSKLTTIAAVFLLCYAIIATLLLTKFFLSSTRTRPFVHEKKKVLVDFNTGFTNSYNAATSGRRNNHMAHYVDTSVVATVQRDENDEQHLRSSLQREEESGDSAVKFDIGDTFRNLVSDEIGEKDKESTILTAYMEPVYLSDWNKKPLPVRNTSANMLKVKRYPNLKSCSKLPEQWPIDDPPTDYDPYLPWIHDVFPTYDGAHIQFIAQNKRRCQSGTKKANTKRYFQPNVALFQHVPVQRVSLDSDEVRYRLSSHQDADHDGIETRFICKFRPSNEETLSVFNVNYDYHTWRKGYKATFTEEGFDNHMIWTSQLLFSCPVPPNLQEMVRSGTSVKDDYATLFVDLIPIRTPPRYSFPVKFLPPRYEKTNTWITDDEWGPHHVLPKIVDSGRYENIPICQPSHMTYPEDESSSLDGGLSVVKFDDEEEKKHHIIACTWASTSFHTRGSRTVVSDGDKRLREWLEFHRLAGIDHVYVYDNSGQFSNTVNLKPVTDLFPGYVTWVNWPAKVCNNNPGTGDNKGERSSQYAAESSCRLRFGAHAQWMASFDTDEYFVPMGDYTNLKDVVASVEKEDVKILSFKSKRARPRLEYLNTTNTGECAGYQCLDPTLPEDKTFLEVFNCDEERPPRTNTMPAEKQIYRPDYVFLHFVHYSTITAESILSEEETKLANIPWRQLYKERHVRYVDEEKEAAMLHAKSIVSKETRRWDKQCRFHGHLCKLGIPFPNDGSKDYDGVVKVTTTVNGIPDLVANCYPHENIDNYWAPLLTAALKKRGFPSSSTTTTT